MRGTVMFVTSPDLAARPDKRNRGHMSQMMTSANYATIVQRAFACTAYNKFGMSSLIFRRQIAEVMEVSE